jgi:NAD(P)-dependent dehydrogenase (short-subunit alcohol dehydrogenase family)
MSVVLITGCSSGFGLEFVRAFSQRGDRVVATVRDPSRAGVLDALVATEASADVDIQQLDVRRQESIDATVRATLERYGRIDVLVNNAGIGAVGALEDVGDAVLRQVFDTNVFGAVALTRAVLPTMRRQGSGRIVFISAIGALLKTPYLGAYCASKHAIDCIAATFDIELRAFGVRASSVLPSAFQTRITDNMSTAFDDDSPYASAAREYYAGLSARVRNGPSDLSPVAAAVVEAATSEDPLQRYLVAPHLADVLGPLVSTLEQLHQRELSLAPSPRPGQV